MYEIHIVIITTVFLRQILLCNDEYMQNNVKVVKNSAINHCYGIKF